MSMPCRFPRPQAGLAQPSLPKLASASSLPDVARSENDLAPRQTPIPPYSSQSALSTALHHRIGPAIPKDQQGQLNSLGGSHPWPTSRRRACACVCVWPIAMLIAFSSNVANVLCSLRFMMRLRDLMSCAYCAARCHAEADH